MFGTKLSVKGDTHCVVSGHPLTVCYVILFLVLPLPPAPPPIPPFPTLPLLCVPFALIEYYTHTLFYLCYRSMGVIVCFLKFIVSIPKMKKSLKL